MTPDKLVRLLHQMAQESLSLAQEMETLNTTPAHRAELRRFVTDSEMYVLATQAMIHKEDAAILKAKMLLSGSRDQAKAFIHEMESSVAVYEKLAALTDTTYLIANGLRGYRWSRQGIAEFRKDLKAQQAWLGGEYLEHAEMTKQENLPSGGIRIEAEWMDTGGHWNTGTKYAGFEGSGYVSPPGQGETSPLVARIKVDAPQKFMASVRALKGGAHQDRALALEVNGKRLKTTHEGPGPAAGSYSWEDAGVVELPAGISELKVLPTGKMFPSPDVIMLTPVE